MILYYIIFIFVQSNYEPLNRNSNCIGQWSWYYRGCWHQTCPPLDMIQIKLSLYSSARIAYTKYARRVGSQVLSLLDSPQSNRAHEVLVYMLGITVRLRSTTEYLLNIYILNRYGLSLPQYLM